MVSFGGMFPVNLMDAEGPNLTLGTALETIVQHRVADLDQKIGAFKVSSASVAVSRFTDSRHRSFRPRSDALEIWRPSRPQV